MPPPGHHHSSSASGQYEYSGNQPGGVNEAYQPSLKLGLGGTLSNTARMASSGNVVPSNDLYTPTGMCVQHDPQDIDSSADAGSIVQNSEPSSAMAHGNLPAYETPRKAHGFNRQPEELHIPSSYSAMGQQQPRGLPQHNSYNSSQEYPRERYGPAADEHGQAKSALPGALQPGNSERPLPSSVNTAPSSVPILAQLQTQSYATPSRSTNASQSHNYSRSSPAGMDQQKYTPYVKTPEESKFSSPPNHKYTSSQASQGGASYSPLGLADIRPRADSGMSDGPVSGNPYSYDGHPSNPTNCNYLAPWAVYAFDWCKWPVQQHGLGDAAGKMAIGSYLEDGHNFVSLLGIGQNPVSTALLTIAQIQVLETQIVPEPDPEPTSSAPKYGIEYTKTAEATHSYPVTRIVWEPASSQKQSTDLLATSGDHLRLWSMPQQAPNYVGNSITRTSNSKESIAQKLTPLALLSNSKSPEHTAPLTSLDWNTLSPSLIITSSIDTTCTIWDIPSLTAKTQLIAHDKEVFDVRFCANSVDVFVSCGADGSVRMFDLRSLEHSTIIYEPSEKGDKCKVPTLQLWVLTDSVMLSREPWRHEPYHCPTNHVIRASFAKISRYAHLKCAR